MMIIEDNDDNNNDDDAYFNHLHTKKGIQVSHYILTCISCAATLIDKFQRLQRLLMLDNFM